MLHMVYSTSIVNNIGIYISRCGNFLHEVIICENY